MNNTPLLMLEIRQLGGALVRIHSGLSPIGRRDSQFTLNRSRSRTATTRRTYCASTATFRLLRRRSNAYESYTCKLRW